MTKLEGSGFIKTSRSRQPESSKRNGLEEVLKEFDELVGLENVKEEINKLIAFAKVIKLRKDRDIPVGAINLHMIFSGPPGTGKTEVARKVGRVLKEIGLLQRGHCVEVDRAALTDVYVNSGAKLITDTVKQAKDGVLFIDEAYTLAGGDALSGPDSSGKEVIDTLLKLMEDNRERLVVIAAGYTNEMRRFVDSNPGLRSRFSRFIEFQSYGGDELFQIFLSMVKRGHYELTPDAEEVARKHIQWLGNQSNDPEFGNARAIRQFFEKILPLQAERIAFTPNYESMTDRELLTIDYDDVALATELD
ncbi:AAA family ATPase [Ferrimonas pelagia]|uniref:AAA family ATPase n=1 Tax=Ferrimonas pelagia TaxID=1177826 RepID=A0ABP9EG31_9GAMM